MTPQVRVGAVAKRSATITDEDIALYGQLTGDRNPIHHDDAFARRSRFGGRIAQGGLVTGVIEALVAAELPGPGSVLLESRLRYLAPVRPGDTITGEVEVTAVRDDKPLVRLAVRVRGPDGTSVVEGEATVLLERPSAETAETR